MNKFKTIGIVSRIKKPQVSALTIELATWLTTRQIQVKIPYEDAKALGKDEFGYRDDEFIRDVELVIVLGGNGTILRAARLIRDKNIPVLGVNLGKFGFLSEVDPKEIYLDLARVLDGQFSIQKRMMLKCQLFKHNKKFAEYNALNEVAVGRRLPHRLIGLDILVNGELFINYLADALIFATPTGSTAYSLSAGGPIVSPLVKTIIMTAVCPHTLFSRSVVFSDQDQIQVRPNPAEEKISLSVDGQPVVETGDIDFLQVSVADFSLSLVKLGKSDFFAIVREKLRLGLEI